MCAFIYRESPFELPGIGAYDMPQNFLGDRRATMHFDFSSRVSLSCDSIEHCSCRVIMAVVFVVISVFSLKICFIVVTPFVLYTFCFVPFFCLALTL